MMLRIKNIVVTIIIFLLFATLGNATYYWETTYDGSVEPDADGWTLGGNDYASSDGDILTINVPSPGTNNNFYYQEPDIDFDAGVFIEFRVKLENDGYMGKYLIHVADGTQNEDIVIWFDEDGTISYRNSSGVETDTGYTGGTTAYHVYYIYIKGTTAYFYVDEGCFSTSWTVYSTTVIDQIQFGDSNTVAYGKTYIDYFNYALDVTDNPMIDIGYEVINRDGTSASGTTRVCIGNPANASGTITSIAIYANESMTGLKVATFYEESTNYLTARDSETIGDVTAGSKQSFQVNLDCETGDYLGCYFTTGKIEVSTDTAEDNYWYLSGDQTSCSNTLFSVSSSGTGMSLFGWGTVEFLEPEPGEGNILFLFTDF